MFKNWISTIATDFILQDAIRRDLTTARRAALLEILWHERYLTRAQLIARVELKIRKNCFGSSAWEDNFYRDLRVVKRAFQAAGQRLQYSRKIGRPGYYLKDQPALSDEFKQLLESSAAEVDPRQIDIYHRLSLPERIHQGVSISDTARKVVAYRILQDNTGMDRAEASRIALHRAYAK